MKDNRVRKKVISLHVDTMEYRAALDRIIISAIERKRGYACFANVHMVIEAYKNDAFASMVNNAMLVLPDGMPLVTALKYLYGIHQERVAGMDIFPDIIKESQVHGLGLFFFGTSNEVLQKIKKRTETLFPDARIAGSFSPPFDRPIDDETYIDRINDSGAHIVFVALGCPKQERWMAANCHKINAILLGVGGAFAVYAGTTKRAPKWVQDLSLEWFFRLCQEPRRLFRRYLTTNTLFCYLLFKARFDKTLNKDSITEK